MNLNRITDIIKGVIEAHKSINSSSFSDITEVQVFDELNIHAYIAIEPMRYVPEADNIQYHFNVLLLNNSAKERTQLITSLNETVAVATEIIFMIDKWFKVDETVIEPHIQTDEQLTIGCSFDLIFRVSLDNDRCEPNPFNDLDNLETELNNNGY